MGTLIGQDAIMWLRDVAITVTMDSGGGSLAEGFVVAVFLVLACNWYFVFLVFVSS